MEIFDMGTFVYNYVGSILRIKHNGELSTSCHWYVAYRPLVIARFQKAVTSLFFGRFCSKFINN